MHFEKIGHRLKVGAFPSKWQISELCKSFKDIQSRKTGIRYIQHLKFLASKRKISQGKPFGWFICIPLRNTFELLMKNT